MKSFKEQSARDITRIRKYFYGVFTALSLTCFTVHAKMPEQYSTAIYYGNHLPVEMLATYQRVIVEPDNTTKEELSLLQKKGVTVYAYLSVGEVGPDRPWYSQLDKSWILGINKGWNSAVMDLDNEGWREYLIQQRMESLWQKGYRGFFLDTMDSYQLFAKTPASLKRQQQGMIKLIRDMHKKFSGLHLIFNRGFEILDDVANLADGLVAESLFSGWDPNNSSYKEVAVNDRKWLLNKLVMVRNKYGLPVTVIDYLPPSQRNQAQQVAKQISNLGFTPWVSTPPLNYMGVGALNLVPRKVLFLYDSLEGELSNNYIHRFLAMPIEYLGYVPEYLDVRKGLPDYPLKGRYAGIVSWFSNHIPERDTTLHEWLQKQQQQNIKIAFLGQLPFATENELTRDLNISLQPGVLQAPIKTEIKSDHVGFEVSPPSRRLGLPIIRVKNAKTWLRVKGSDGTISEPVVISSWGGMALHPYVIFHVESPVSMLSESDRWIINPFKFIQAALDLQEIPVPDATTENGRRLLMIHIDGDSFYNKTELGGDRYSAELILDEFIKPHALPHTVSIIEGEIGDKGMKPSLSPALEKIARGIFTLPNVEIASHTYSRPFDWFAAAQEGLSKEPLVKTDTKLKQAVYKAEDGISHLPIPGYRYNAEREVAGSVNYIDNHLAPPGKKTQVMLWSGNYLPNEEALSWTYRLNISNMNGGDTIIRKDLDSLTHVSASGIVRGKYFQPYAPIQNENVYTDEWTGPYFGFQRVIETFQMTDSPRRLKPIDIYYHFYSGDQLASVGALHRVYDWALQQQTLPLWISEYTPRVLAFRSAVFEKLSDGWRIHGASDIRTLRMPPDLLYPNLTASEGIVGYRKLSQGLYVSLDGSETINLSFANTQIQVPYLLHANASVQYWRKNNNSIEFRLVGHQPVELVIAGLDKNCLVKNSIGERLHGRLKQDSREFQFKGKDTGDMRILCG